MQVTPSINIGLGEFGNKYIESLFEIFSDFENDLERFAIASAITFNNNKLEFTNLSNRETYNKEINLETTNRRSLIEHLEQHQSLIFFNDNIDALYSQIRNLQVNIRSSQFTISSNSVIVNIIVPFFELNAITILHPLLESLDNLKLSGQLQGITVRVFSILSKTKDDGNNSVNDIATTYIGLKEITSFIDKYPSILHHVFFIGSKNSDAIVINFTRESLAFALNEFIILEMQHHYKMLAAINDKLLSYGVGVIHFNDVLFRRFIYYKILEYKFKEEGIGKHARIDTDKIIQKTNEFLEEHQNFFNTFISKHVSDPKILEQDTDTIIGNLDNNVELFYKEFSKSIETFIETPWSKVSEAKAVIANLLGEDDEKLTGIINIYERLTIEDIEFDVIKFFNTLLPIDEQVNRDEIKKLREKITDKSNYIKQLKKELKEIQTGLDIVEDDTDISFKNGIFSFNGKKINANGYIPSQPKPDDVYFENINNEELPEYVNLKGYFLPVKNQGKLGSCSAFPISATYEYFAEKNNKNVNVSELFIYYNARLARGKEKEDSGAYLSDAIEGVKKFGACFNSTWKYNVSKFHDKPSEEAYKEAKQFLADKYYRIQPNIKDLKFALAKGYPVIFGLKLYKSFYVRNNTGIIPFPSAKEQKLGKYGNHAMLLIGYSDQEKLFLVRNSWGTDFGESGYCYIPYDYLANPMYCSEAFIIQQIVDLDYNGISTVTSNVNFFFSQHKDLVRKNIIEYELRRNDKELKDLQKQLKEDTEKYEEQIQNLKNPSFRKRLLKNKLDILEDEKKKTLLQKENQGLDDTHVKQKNTTLFLGILLTIASIGFSPFTSFLSLIGLLPSLFLIYYSFKKKKNIKRVVDNETYKVLHNPEAERIDKEIKELRINFKAASLLLDKMNSLSNDLRTYLKSLNNFDENISLWSEEINTEQRKIKFESPTFVINLINEKRLLRYISDGRNTWLDKLVSFSKFFFDIYSLDTDITMEKIISDLKNNTKNNINQQINNILDFSMIRYLLDKGDDNEEYIYFNDHESINTLFEKLEKLSVPFANKTTDLTEPDSTHQMIVLGNEKESIIERFKDELSMFYTGTLPTSLIIRNNKKLSMLKIETGIKIENLVAFRKSLVEYELLKEEQKNNEYKICLK